MRRSAPHVGLQHMYRFTQADNFEALQFFERAIEQDAEFSRAHAGASFARFQNAFLRYTGDTAQEIKLARQSAQKTVQLDESDPSANLDDGPILVAGR